MRYMTHTRLLHILRGMKQKRNAFLLAFTQLSDRISKVLDE